MRNTSNVCFRATASNDKTRTVVVPSKTCQGKVSGRDLGVRISASKLGQSGLGAGVSNVSIFTFTISGTPGDITTLLRGLRVPRRSVSYFMFRRTGEFLGRGVEGGLGVSTSGMPCSLLGCKGADYTAVPLALIARERRRLRGSQVGVMKYTFKMKLS